MIITESGWINECSDCFSVWKKIPELNQQEIAEAISSRQNVLATDVKRRLHGWYLCEEFSDLEEAKQFLEGPASVDKLKEIEDQLEAHFTSSSALPQTVRGGRTMNEAEMLAEELNRLEAWPDVNRGKVTLQDQDGNPLIPEVEGEGYVDPHPEGSDRGGYVPYWERNGAQVYYDENGEGWVG